MSAKDKLMQKLLSRPRDFTYEEAKTLLSKLGYSECNKGKTSGSRVKFAKSLNDTKIVVLLHKPHPDNNLKLYLIDDLIGQLKGSGDIE